MSEIILNQKACPLLLHEGVGGVLNCVGDKCAWYIGVYRDCTLPLVAQALVALADSYQKKGGLHE